MPRFLDLAHRFLLRVADPERVDELNAALVGRLGDWRRLRDVVTVARRATPPAWWRGDAHAVSSSVAAAGQLAAGGER